MNLLFQEVKIQNLKAIHNEPSHNSNSFTTVSGGKDTKSESNSQQTKTTGKKATNCFRR